MENLISDIQGFTLSQDPSSFPLLRPSYPNQQAQRVRRNPASRSTKITQLKNTKFD